MIHIASEFKVQQGISVFLNKEDTVSLQVISFNEDRQEIEENLIVFNPQHVPGLIKALTSLLEEIEEEGGKK